MGSKSGATDGGGKIGVRRVTPDGGYGRPKRVSARNRTLSAPRPSLISRAGYWSAHGKDQLLQEVGGALRKIEVREPLDGADEWAGGSREAEGEVVGPRLDPPGPAVDDRERDPC